MLFGAVTLLSTNSPGEYTTSSSTCGMRTFCTNDKGSVNRRFLYTHDPRSLDYVRCVDSNFVLKVHVVGQEKRPLQKH